MTFTQPSNELLASLFIQFLLVVCAQGMLSKYLSSVSHMLQLVPVIHRPPLEGERPKCINSHNKV